MNSAAKTKKKVKNRLKSNIIKGTLILSCASILSRIIGFIYRIYLADILGEQLRYISAYFSYICAVLYDLRSGYAKCHISGCCDTHGHK